LQKEFFTITREIGIDAMHRVPTHGSKCKRYHGHRYTIEATCRARNGLIGEGEQSGMVIEFSFLKDEMMRMIDQYCDHGCIAWVEDRSLLHRLYPFRSVDLNVDGWLHHVKQEVLQKGFFFDVYEDVKLYIIDCIPTAENLAKHWFGRLAPQVTERTEGKASLMKIVVHETPNCSAQYSAMEIKDEEEEE
jgi:6-pyruvoyltetrahydropterin/6-carboxytetrahydropterin synthase